MDFARFASAICRITACHLVWAASVALIWVIAVDDALPQTGPLGSEFHVNVNAFGNQAIPEVASNSSGDFVVTWFVSNHRTVSCRLFDSDGLPVTGEILLTAGEGTIDPPSVAISDAGDFVVVWSERGVDGSDYGVSGRRLNNQGQFVGGEFPVNSYTTGSQRKPTVSMRNDGGFVVVWESHEQDGTPSSIFAQRFDSNGTPVGLEFQINEDTAGGQESPEVAMNRDSGEFVVTWFSHGSGLGGEIASRRFGALGTPISGDVRVDQAAGSGIRPRVSLNRSNEFVVVWHEKKGLQYDVFGSRFIGDQSLGNSFQINTYTTDSQRRPEVDVHDSGRFVVAWQSPGLDGSENAIVVQDFDFDTGEPMSPEFVANVATLGWQSNAAVAFTNPVNFVVVWQGPQASTENEIFGRRFGCDPLPDPITDLRVSMTPDGTELHFTWIDSTTADSYLVVSDPLPSGPSNSVEGVAATGSEGLLLPLPSGSMFYLVAGSNNCGRGPVR